MIKAVVITITMPFLIHTLAVVTSKMFFRAILIYMLVFL